MVQIVLLSILVVTILYKNVEGLSRIDPLVNTNVGLIRGLKASDGDYAMFLGIPYGAVDKTNPFGPSSPHPAFQDTFEAYSDLVVCPQSGGYGGYSDEDETGYIKSLDCLNLNVYVPTTANSNNLLPVMLWIHGGGFRSGAGSTDYNNPKYLTEHDVIVVSINYRLGAYGFMCLDTPEVPGNQGLKDQLMAMRWVKDNIGAFGGDSNRITIAGQSAGAMSVGLHLFSEPEKVFSHVILESGSPFIPEFPIESDPTAPTKLAELLGFSTNDTSEALSFLASVEPNLVTVTANSEMGRFMACAEKTFDGVEKFLSDYPINMEIPKVKGMPILIGVNTKELQSGADSFDANLKMGFDFNDDEYEQMEEILRRFYIGDEEIVKKELANFDSDFNFNYPAHRSVNKFVENGAEKVFYYVFNYVGGLNTAQGVDSPDSVEANHGAELGYLFGSAKTLDEFAPEDRLMIQRMTTMWTNFIKYGDPTPETTETLPVKWIPVTKGSLQYYMDIDAELKIEMRPFYQRMSFWDLFYTVYEKHQKGYRDN